MEEAIVDAALRLFDERGIDATSADDIAAAVGISRATFFNHFPYKEGVLVAIGARFVGEIALAAATHRRRSVRHALYDLGDAIAAIGQAHENIVPFLAREIAHPDAERRRYAIERMGYPLLYEAMLDHLALSGQLRSRSRRSSYARQLVDLTTGTLMRVGDEVALADLRKELRANVDLFWTGAIRPAPRRGRGPRPRTSRPAR